MTLTLEAPDSTEIENFSSSGWEPTPRHVAYIPNGKVTGLSKLARVVDEVARRPQVQERMTHTVADMVADELQVRWGRRRGAGGALLHVHPGNLQTR